jgi:crossover junction endodeoxyribonuclease RuvC
MKKATAPLRILGLDPGSRITGYGVIDLQERETVFVACGVIKTDTRQDFPHRLHEIYAGINDVISTHKPQAAAVEDIFFARNPRSALKLGQARGAIIVAAMSHSLTVNEFTAKQVKQAVAGYGQAAKPQVQHMVRLLLSLNAQPSEDAADALAIALCLANHLVNQTR